MRVVFLTDQTGPTGGNRTIITLATGLYKKGHEVRIITNRYIKWLDTPVEIQEMKTIPEQVKSVERNEIPIATWWPTAYTAMRCKSKYKVYLCQHYETIFGDMRAKRTYDFPLYLICTSTWLANEIRSKHKKRNPYVIIPGVDPKIFYPRKVQKHRNRIIGLSAYQDFKGFLDMLIPAFHKALEERPDLELHTFGNLPYKEKRVIYHPRLTDDELAELYSSGMIYVCSSSLESSPLPVIEAMACGTPVISTSKGTDDFIENGVDGYIIERDVDILAEKMLEVISSPDYEQLRRAALRKASERTYENTINEFERILLEINSGRGHL